ncbi:glycosyltransferase family 2 protein [Microbacterium murale]|uniref:Glycosyltransferase involved in cell wall biosynthesis n=1 Tax=Microbacterium murale TaxID=1081040 RepID=A0ABU0PCG2_9MICO|nr:glycosyltransferase family A protein [Microbacterium murale]MDQ0644602.1 glycosyltransferase involved in cell wall biosynthesis [Microbacterium murale]
MGDTSAPAPLVSIVLALGHDSEYLAAALQGVRDQTFQDWELLVVDNGAAHPERVEALIQDDPRMSMITIEHSATAGLSRNIGVERTRGALITFLDDDDIWMPERLAVHAAHHLETPSAPASFSGYRHIDAAGAAFGADWRSRQTPASDILRGTAPTPLGPTLMIRRDQFLAIGGHSPEIPILVDFELGLRLALRGDLIYIDELLVRYRRHSSNMTSMAPANVRLRRLAMEDMIDRQRWAARGRGATEVAGYFTERLERYRRSESRIAGIDAPRQLRRGDLGDAARSAAWGLRRAPLAFLGGAISTVTGRARRS